MLCECLNPITKIIDASRMSWEGCNIKVNARSYSALAFRISGTAKIRVKTKEYFINENDVLYLPAGISYDAEYSNTELLVIHFNTAKKDTAPEVYSLSNTEEIYKAFLSANILWQEKKPGNEAFIRSKIYYILGKLHEADITAEVPAFFQTAVSFINSEFKNSLLTIEKICDFSGISATALRSLFQKYYGKSPTEYIRKLRLEYARNLIACGVSISSAAEKSGFNDPKYFARVVKKEYHCTPKELKSYGK